MRLLHPSLGLLLFGIAAAEEAIANLATAITTADARANIHIKAASATPLLLTSTAQPPPLSINSQLSDSNFVGKAGLRPTVTVTVFETYTTSIGTWFLPADGVDGSKVEPTIQKAAAAEKTVTVVETVTVEVGSWYVPGSEDDPKCGVGDGSTSFSANSSFPGATIMPVGLPTALSGANRGMGNTPGVSSASRPGTQAAAGMPSQTTAIASGNSTGVQAYQPPSSLISSLPGILSTPSAGSPTFMEASQSIDMPSGLPTVFPDYTYSDTPPKTGAKAPASANAPTSAANGMLSSALGAGSWNAASATSMQAVSGQPLSNLAPSTTPHPTGASLSAQSAMPSNSAPSSPAGGVSPNGLCGASNNGWTCPGSGFGDCCSQWGFCGTGADFCGNASSMQAVSGPSPSNLASSAMLPPAGVAPSAQSGLPSNTLSPSQTGGVSPNGLCGASNNGWTCQGSGFGDCCSQWGFCGTGDEFCGKPSSMQAVSGPAISNQAPSTILPPAGATLSAQPGLPSNTAASSPTGGISPNGLCGASNSGWVCQGSGFGDCCSRWGFCGTGDDFCGNERIPGPSNSYDAQGYSGLPTNTAKNIQPTGSAPAVSSPLGNSSAEAPGATIGAVSMPEGLPTVFPDYTYSDTPPKTGAHLQSPASGVAQPSIAKIPGPGSSAASLSSKPAGAGIGQPAASSTQIAALGESTVEVTGIYKSIAQISRPPSKLPQGSPNPGLPPLSSLPEPTPPSVQPNPRSGQRGMHYSDLSFQSHASVSTETVLYTIIASILVTKTMQVPDAPPVRANVELGHLRRALVESTSNSTHNTQHTSHSATGLISHVSHPLSVSNATQRSRTTGYNHTSTAYVCPISYVSATNTQKSATSNQSKPGTSQAAHLHSWPSIAMSWDLPTQTLTSTPSSTPSLWEVVYGSSSLTSTTSPWHATSSDFPKIAHTSTLTITTVVRRAEVRQVSPSPNSARSGWFARWWLTPRGRRTTKAENPKKKMEHTVSDMAYESAIEAQASESVAKDAIKKRELEAMSMYWGPFSSGTAPTSPATTPGRLLGNATSSSSSSSLTPFRPQPEAGNLNDGHDAVVPATPSSIFVLVTPFSSPSSLIPSSSYIPMTPSSRPFPEIAYSWPSTHGSPTASYHSPAPKPSSPSTTTGTWIPPFWDPSCVYTTTETILPLGGATSVVELTQTWTGCWVATAPGYSSKVLYTPAHSVQSVASSPIPAATSPSTSAALSSPTHAAASSPTSVALSSPTQATPSSPAPAATSPPPSAAPSSPVSLAPSPPTPLPPSPAPSSPLQSTPVASSQTDHAPGHHSPAPSPSSPPSSSPSSSPSTPNPTPSPSILATPQPPISHPTTLPEWLPFTPAASDLSTPTSTAKNTTSSSNSLDEYHVTRITWGLWSLAIIMGVTNLLQLAVDIGGLGALGVAGLGEVMV